MALKTFNIDDKVYKQFSKHCKGHGISMSKQVENFISAEIAKLAGIDSKDVKNQEETIDSRKIEKSFKDFDKSLKFDEHPLKKYC